jgi:hypothetical protein
VAGSKSKVSSVTQQASVVFAGNDIDIQTVEDVEIKGSKFEVK